jgi:phage FluMu protein Com
LVLPEVPQRTAALESLAARQRCLIPPNVPINISMDERNPILIDPTDEPDVQMGGVVPEGSVATRGTIVARCQSCSVALRVSLKATLVRCPKCRELSPASDRPAQAAAATTDDSSSM